MPSLEHTVLVPYLDPAATATSGAAELENVIRWDDLLAAGEGAELTFERVPFDHPLWVLYSSGTTGLPKAIVQGQGGILLEQLKKMHLHLDAKPGDRLFWFTTTGWMMWNFIVSGLLTEAAIVLYDGNPGYPDMGALWDLAETAGITTFGTSAAYISACMKAGVEPGGGPRPLPPARGRLDRQPARPRGLRLDLRAPRARTPGSSRPRAGPTSAPPSSAGSRRCRSTAASCRRGRWAAKVEAWDEEGHPHHRRGRRAGDHRADALDAALPLGRRGRLAATASPTSRCSRGSGATATGSRSPSAAPRSSTAARDSTINRGGIRIGTAEIYRAVLDSDESSTPSSSTSRRRAPTA